jgi:hypothetical protein
VLSRIFGPKKEEIDNGKTAGRKAPISVRWVNQGKYNKQCRWLIYGGRETHTGFW